MNVLLLLGMLVCFAVGVAVPAERNALDCQMCELAVKTIDGPADRDATDIKKDFDAECKKMFHSIPFAPKECEHYVNTKIDPIIKELGSGTAPKDVCKKLHEC